ncbi:primosomal protein N' (replication factor Y) [Hamadaea flava]|nr:primosomal protein N' (replication factor Y) [Hamadaea flava]
MTSKTKRSDRQPASGLPVARVCVDVPLPHLDRPFDYLVPADLDTAAQPGTRVRVRFSGQLVDGWLLDRVEHTELDRKLAFLEKVVSPEPVLRPEIIRLARDIADRYAGSLIDVLRLAVPPRHAAAEKAAPNTPKPPGRREERPGWGHYAAGQAFLRALADGKSPRAVWSALPGERWPDRVAAAVADTLASGRGAVVIVADYRDLDRLDAALTAALGGDDQHVALSAALGPAERYKRFLRVSRGEVQVVIGTRGASFAPVRDLGLVVIWDDGDDLHAEPRSPYPHARQVLLSRAQLTGCAALVGGYARTAEGQLLVETGWAKEITPSRETLRVLSPRIVTADDRQLARDPGAVAARLPSVAWDAAREAMRADAPVLIQVPRRGYVPSVACQECRERARCSRCSGPLALPGNAGPPACRWCARPAADYTCPRCGGRRLRASVTGVRRTAEELGRAFPGVPVRTSGGESVLATVPAEASLVLATPGAEPIVDGPGYGAVLLLDTWAMLTRADLRAAEEALRRWMAAAALAVPAGKGGKVVVVADGSMIPVQALLRWDAAWLAERELADRRALGFPPAARMASLTGPPAAVAELTESADLPPGTEQLGPLEIGEGSERLLLRVRRSEAAALAHALHAAAGTRSARKSADAVRVQLDPLELL